MGTVSSSASQSRPKMIFLLFISMAAPCLGRSHSADLEMIPTHWESVSPQLHPIMKEFSTAVKQAHQTLVKKASKSTDVSICGVLQTVHTLVIQARQALDCGSAAGVSSSDLLSNNDHKAVVESTRSCLGSDDLCLIKKLRSLVTIKSLGLVCSAVRDVESAVETALDIFCHEELGATLNCWTCAGEVLAAANGCRGRVGWQLVSKLLLELAVIVCLVFARLLHVTNI